MQVTGHGHLTTNALDLATRKLTAMSASALAKKEHNSQVPIDHTACALSSATGLFPAAGQELSLAIRPTITASEQSAPFTLTVSNLTT
jgi:hypothetical protein